MKKNIIFISLIVIILAGAGIWYVINKENKNLSPIAQVTYTCDGDKTIEAIFYKGESKPVKPGEPPIPSGSVKIVLSDGQNFDLPQTISADGSRYANSDESFVFWSKGDGALVLENNVEKNYTGCIVPVKGIKVISPNGGEVWSRGQKVKILWNAAKEIKSVNIRLVISGNEDSQNFNAAIASDVPNTGNYEWTVQDLYAEVLGIKALPASNKYLITIEDKDHNNIYDMSDTTFSIKYSFTNPNGEYNFEYPSIWKVAINEYNNNNSLFGPGANSSSGTGGVEVFNQQTSIDKFLSGVDAIIIEKKDITIDGISGVYTHYKGFPASGVQAVLSKNGKIYNIYLNSEKNEDIELFNQILSTFKFIE